MFPFLGHIDPDDFFRFINHIPNKIVCFFFEHDFVLINSGDLMDTYKCSWCECVEHK